MTSRDPARHAERIEAILSSLERITGGDLTAEIPVSSWRDDLDAIAVGVNILAAELRYTTVSQRYVDRIINSMTDLLLVVDADGRILKINESTSAVLGLPLASILRRSIDSLAVTLDPTPVSAQLRDATAEDAPWTAELELVAADGERIPVAACASPITTASGTRTDQVVVARDLREERRQAEARRSLEAQLLHTQKMEALGRFASAIAHDFGNLLNAIVGYAELLADALDPDDPRHEDADGILQAADHAEHLIQQLLAFARRQPMVPRRVSPSVLVRGAERLLARLLGVDIALVTRLDPGAGDVEIGPGQLEQVLVNMAVNARRAMPDGGTLEIETARRVVDDDATVPSLPAGEYVVIKVADDGVGMTEEVRVKLFEPFFTTREVNEGTGLGLAMCYGIVTRAGGAIEVESEPGRGAAFSIYLPRCRESEARAAG